MDGTDIIRDPFADTQVKSAETRVKFRDTGTVRDIPAEWAEPLIKHVYEHHPQAFRCAMSAVMGVEDTPKPGRKRADG
jgi:hypothetical protein